MNQWRSVLAGVGGAIVVVVAGSAFFNNSLLPKYHQDAINPTGVFALALLVIVVGALLLLRWWPYLLLVAALLAVLIVVLVLPDADEAFYSIPDPLLLLLHYGPYPLALIGALGCAQSLRDRGAVVAGLTGGAMVFAGALTGSIRWLHGPIDASWHTVLIAVGLVALLPALWTLRHGDTAAALPAGPRGVWQAVATGLVLSLAVPAGWIGDQMIALHIVPWEDPGRVGLLIGPAIVVVATGLIGLGGAWTVAGTLTGAAILVSVAMPLYLAVGSLRQDGPAGWLAAAAGLALGAAVAVTRWRVYGAVALTVAAAVTLVLTRDLIWLGLLAGERDPRAYPLVVVCVAATVAVFAATATVLAPHGAVPAALGPLAVTVAIGGLHTINGAALWSSGSEGVHFTVSAALALVAGLGVAGLGLAGYRIGRRASAGDPVPDAATVAP
ncbi:hypothetical protein [Actinoplanes sichuanensis]|uniref:Uncharacterized protein n=1 Tax=Actinoplanes sichuanensis TaxID=512349 RepID=A0ABW4ASA0_9ACTN|nr:hypothetical protein [Actinoplanes sichuanensis]